MDNTNVINDVMEMVANVGAKADVEVLHSTGILLEFPKKSYDFSDYAYELFGKPVKVDVSPSVIAEMEGELGMELIDGHVGIKAELARIERENEEYGR